MKFDIPSNSKEDDISNVLKMGILKFEIVIQVYMLYKCEI